MPTQTRTGRRPSRSIKLPPPAEVQADVVTEFLAQLGYDEQHVRRITSVRIGPRQVQVDIRGRADVKLTVSHPVVWEDDA